MGGGDDGGLGGGGVGGLRLGYLVLVVWLGGDVGGGDKIGMWEGMMG